MEWSSSLNITVSEVRRGVTITILHVDGRINLSNTDVLEQAARDAFASGARDILLDLNNVPSLTSSGLRSIHWIYTLLNQPPSGEEPLPDSPKSKSPHIKLFTTSPHVLKVLHVAGFDLYIDIYQDLNEAITAF